MINMNNCISKKSSRINKYKRNRLEASKFEEDSRALRALEKKNNQKLKREKSVAKFRGLSTPVERGNGPAKSFGGNSTRKYTPAERKELGRLRYLEMLKWKEEKKRQLEEEKRKRKPSFKTGIFQPDKPKFLCGEGDTSYIDPTTPWKFASLKSTGKKSAPPSSTKTRERIIGKVSKPLVFHSGATPQFGPSTSARVLGHVKRERKLKGTPLGANSLGVAPLPATPGVNSLSQLKSNRKSFAPRNFNFQAPKGVKKFHIDKSEDFPAVKEEMRASHKGLDSVHGIEKSATNDATEKEGPVARLEDELSADCNFETRVNIKNLVREKNIALSLEHQPCIEEHSKFGVETKASHKKLDTTSELDGGLKQERAVIEDYVRPCTDNETDAEDEFHKIDSLKTKERDADSGADKGIICSEEYGSSEANTLNAGSTPAPRYSMRKRSVNISASTPPLAKLRPRTPCSRSTRRSKSAHCNLMLEQDISAPTPKSKKKKSVKKSMSSKNSVCFDVNDVPDENEPPISDRNGSQGDYQHSLKDLDTPPTTKQIETPLTASRLKELASSPWITRSRGSSSSSKKKRRSVFGNPLEELFNEEEPLNDTKHEDDGSSPCLKQSLILGGTDISELIQPSKNIFDSPGSNVWGGISNENTPVGRTCDSGKEIVPSEEGERKPLFEITSSSLRAAADNNNLLRREGRKSKRFSVSFASDNKMDDSGSVKYPSTPIGRRSEHFSRAKQQQRISLLPGLSPFRESKDKMDAAAVGGEEDVDLISWDSPDLFPVSSRKNTPSDANTPLRRSKRLSKLC